MRAEVQCTLACILVLARASAQSPVPDAIGLGDTSRGFIRSDQPRELHLKIPGAQFVSLSIDCAQSSLRFRLISPRHEVLAEAQPPPGLYGLGVLSAVLPSPGDYILEIALPDQPNSSGYFELLVTELREVNPNDEIRSRAESKALAKFNWAHSAADVSDEDKLSIPPEYESICSISPSPLCSGRAALMTGRILFDLNRFSGAIASLRHAFDLVEAEPRSAIHVGILNALGLVQSLSGDTTNGFATFELSLAASRRLQSGYFAAETLLLMSSMSRRRGDTALERRYTEQVLEQALAGGFDMLAAQSGIQLARAYDGTNALYATIHARAAAEAFRRMGYRPGEGIANAVLGRILFDAGDFDGALLAASASAAIHRETGGIDAEASVLPLIGAIFQRLGDFDKAAAQFDRALEITRNGDKAVEAGLLITAAELNLLRGDRTKAENQYLESEAITRVLPAPRLEAIAEIGLARAADPANSAIIFDHYERAAQICRSLGDRRCEADALSGEAELTSATSSIKLRETAKNLYNSAGDRFGEAVSELALGRIIRGQGHLLDSLPHLSAALERVENLRASIHAPGLRMTYFGQLRVFYDALIDLLMQLHQSAPEQGYDLQALHVSEQSRARVLLDSAIQAGIERVASSQGALQEKDQQLRRQIATAAGDPSLRLPNADQSKLLALLTEHELVQTRLQAENPRYAALAGLSVLTAWDIRHTLLDDRTALLEYRLAPGKSYLWLLTAKGHSIHELPSAEVLNHLAEQVLAAQNAPDTLDADRRYRLAAEALSAVILDPIASHLGNRRLLIVADGKLQGVSFAALPVLVGKRPRSSLITFADVIQIPSASVLAAIRAQSHKSTAPTQKILVFADPVFGPADGRATFKTGQQTPGYWPRLPATGDEAETIASVVGRQNITIHKGFDATVAAATGPEAANYRTLQFSTHTFIDEARPDLSGILLSQFDRTGRPIQGMLRMLDIYEMNLNSDLVVLSTCESAVGHEVAGEGLIALSRAFMYAGVRSVIASVRTLPSRLAEQFIGHFYAAMITKNLPPAVALAEVQRDMQAKGLSPRKWGAFLFIGDWKAGE